jgi:hypothetical protein
MENTMTFHTPTPGNAPGLSASRIDTPDVIKARIAEWCAWFDLEPPHLKIRKGEIYLTDSLAGWLGTSGASYDWILCGDAKCMAVVYREKYAMESRVLNALKGFDDVEVAMLTAALERANTNGVSITDVLAEWQTAVDAHRAARRAQVPDPVAEYWSHNPAMRDAALQAHESGESLDVLVKG